MINDKDDDDSGYGLVSLLFDSPGGGLRDLLLGFSCGGELYNRTITLHLPLSAMGYKLK